MQPNRAVTPWGATASLVTFALVVTTIVAGFTLLALTSGNGGTEDDELAGHTCVTVGPDDYLRADDFTRDGVVRRAAERTVVCRAHDSLDHPRLVQGLVDLRTLPIVLSILACLVGLRRVIERTRDDGPFSSDAARLIFRLRWWAAGFVLAGVTGTRVLEGIANDVVANAPWPEYETFWPAIGTFIGLTIAAKICDFGTDQRLAAYGRGRESSAADAS